MPPTFCCSTRRHRRCRAEPGTRFDWSLLAGHRHKLPWGLAGGLTPDNVAEAIRVTHAPLVDTSSGVESAPGIKDVDKIASFLQSGPRHITAPYRSC